MVELDYTKATDEEIQADIIVKAKEDYVATQEEIRKEAFFEARQQALTDLQNLWQLKEDNGYDVNYTP